MSSMGIGKTAIQNNIRFLKKKAYITRAGSHKTDCWEARQHKSLQQKIQRRMYRPQKLDQNLRIGAWYTKPCIFIAQHNLHGLD